MRARNPRRKAASALERLEAAKPGLGRLDAARRLREAAEEVEEVELRAARAAGATWTEIGSCYGLSKQGAQQRFSRRKAAGPDPEGRDGPRG